MLVKKYSFKHNNGRNALGIFVDDKLIIDGVHECKDLEQHEKVAVSRIRDNLEQRLDRIRIVKEPWK